MLQECISAVVIAIIILLLFLTISGKIDSKFALIVGSFVVGGGVLGYMMMNDKVFGGAFTPQEKHQIQSRISKIDNNIQILQTQINALIMEKNDLAKKLALDEDDIILKSTNVRIVENPTFEDIVYTYNLIKNTSLVLGETWNYNYKPFNEQTKAILCACQLQHYHGREKAMHLPSSSNYAETLRNRYTEQVARLKKQILIIAEKDRIGKIDNYEKSLPEYTAIFPK